MRPSLFLPIRNFCNKMSSKNGKPLLVAIEGNIGVGKTTALEIISKLYPSVQTVREPVETWRNLKCPISGKTYNYFDLFYNDTKTQAFPFQVLVQSSYFRELAGVYKRALSEGSRLVVTERTLGTNLMVFGKTLLSDNLLSDQEFAVLAYNFDTNLQLHPHFGKYDLVVHLRASTVTCLQRTNHRKRPEEQGYVALEYLERVEKTYEQWQKQHFEPLSAKRVLELSTECDLVQFESSLKTIFDELM